MRRALARVFDAAKAENCIPISGKDRLLMTQVAFFDDPARCAQKANELADELEQRIADGVSVFPEGTKRILIAGTPMAIPYMKLGPIIRKATRDSSKRALPRSSKCCKSQSRRRRERP